MTEVTYANFIKLTYSGYDKWTATWEGWPSDGSKKVRRTIQLEANEKREDAAERAARLFADWLETGPMGDKCACQIDSITMGNMNADAYAVGVQTSWAPRDA